MSTRRTGRLRLVLTIVVAVVATTAVGASAAMKDDPDTKLIIQATLKDASPLLEGNDVRIKGVRVGTIANMSIVNGGARLMLELDATALPVYRDATVAIRPVSLLGERYVDLDPGTPAASEMNDGGSIKSGNTRQSTDLDQVLNTLDQPTSQSLAMLVTALGMGADKNGKNVDDAVKALLPAMTQTDRLARVLKDQNQTLGSLVDSLEPVAKGLSVDEGKALDDLVGSTQEVLHSTAVNEAAFRDLMSQLPGTMVAARRTLGHLEGTADAAVPVLDELRPTTQNLDKISKELLTFADSADPALRAANPVLRKAETLLDAARPVAEQLKQQGGAISSSATSLEPLSKELGENAMTGLMEFIRGWALTTNYKDGLSHYFRAAIIVEPLPLASGMVPGGLGELDGASENAPPAKDTTPPGRGAKANDDAGDNNGLPEALKGLGGLPPGLLSPKTSKDGGVTGLTPKQEQGALSFLLGGN